DVGEGRTAFDVAQRPDVWHVRFQSAVDLDEPCWCQLHSGRFQPQVVRVGPAARGDQQMGATQRLRAAPRFYCYDDLVVLLLDVSCIGLKKKPHSFFSQRRLQLLADVDVFTGEDVGALVDDGDLAAEPPKHLPELQANVSASKNEQVFGHL